MIKQKVFRLSPHTSQYANTILHLLLSLSFILMVSTTTIAQVTTSSQNVPTPEQMTKDAESQGFSQSDLQRLGIDVSKPDQALQRARVLGIPESQIQQYLQQYQNAEETTGSELEDQLDSDLPNELQEETEDVPADTSSENETDINNEFMGSGRFAGLEYFGYRILRAGSGNFDALEGGPVDPGYIISAGDVIRLYLWGDVEYQGELTVDRNGNIAIPRAGQFFASGNRLDDLRNNLKNYLSKFYSGLRSDPQTVFMDVSIARIQGNQIYLMGDVNRPGSYTISSFATAFNLMYATGGPTVNGSLRDIRVLRNGKITASIDFYDYMLKGVSSDDLRLQNNDVVFVPQRGKTVSIGGEVNKPGIFELVKNENLSDLIDFAGGTKNTAYSFRIQVDRIIPLKERAKGEPDRKMLDFNLNDILSGKEKIVLQDGDVVFIFPYTDMLVNYVDLIGSGITRPGRYELNTDINTLSDLIDAAEGLTGDAYMMKADIVRSLPDMSQEFISVDVDEALKNNPDHNISLWPMDRVKLYARIDWNKEPEVELKGFVANPGLYPLPKNKTLYDLLFEYSGLQDSTFYARVYKEKVDILRMGPDGKNRILITRNLADVWNQVPGSELELIDKDIVFLHEKTVEEVFSHRIIISGHIKHPGSYELTDNMTLTDLLRMAGGFTEDAWVLEAEVSRVNLMGFAGETLAEVIHVPLADWDGEIDNPDIIVPSIFKDDSEASNFYLKPSDHVRIRNNPDFEQPGQVTITGEVVFPGTYTLQRENETLSDLIKRAGGLTAIAHSEGGQFYREDVRLFLDYHQLLIKGDKREDVILHPGDRIDIPKRPNSVSVFGEVNNTGLYKYISGKKAKSYIREAGGLKENAGQAYIIYPSGRTYQISWRKNPKVIDGSTIRVLPKPPKEEKEPIDWTGIIKDTLAILASAATVIAVIDRVN